MNPKSTTQLLWDGSASYKDDGFELIQNNYTKPLSTSARKLFDLLLSAYTSAPNQKGMVTLSLDDFAELRGIDDMDNARKEARTALRELIQIELTAEDRTRRGKRIWTGRIALNGGLALVRQGAIEWNFNTALLQFIDNAYTAEISKKAYLTNDHDNPHSFFFMRQIDLNYRQNEGKARCETISVKTLLLSAPGLAALVSFPDRPNPYALKRDHRTRIMNPFFRDLDALSVSYELFSNKGERIDDRKKLRYSDFLKANIKVDYSEYPKHEGSIRKRRAMAEKGKRQALDDEA